MSQPIRLIISVQMETSQIAEIAEIAAYLHEM